MFSIHRKLFLALKKVRIVKNLPSPSKFSDSPLPLTAIWKTLMENFIFCKVAVVPAPLQRLGLNINMSIA